MSKLWILKIESSKSSMMIISKWNMRFKIAKEFPNLKKKRKPD